jgi:pyrroline-5-carboxylate reductase
MDKKIGIIGYGSMGKMIFSKFIESKIIPESDIFVSNRTYEKIKDLQKIYPKLNICKNNIEAAGDADILFICVKPSEIKTVLSEIFEKIKTDCHIVSLNGSVLFSHMEQICKSMKISKIIPSVTAEVNQSVTLVCRNTHVNDDDRSALKALLESFGTVIEVSETEIGICSELTSCMPGFIGAIFKVITDEAEKYTSLDKKDIINMVIKTLYGTGKLLLESEMTFDKLISRVATKGGITEEGTKVIEKEMPKMANELFEKTLEKRKMTNETLKKNLNFINRNEFKNILENNKIEKRYYDLIKIINESNEGNKEKIIDEIDSKILLGIKYRSCTVLGLDLYGYSKFEIKEQTLIPLVFDLIYQETIENSVDYEGSFFEGYSFKDNFISTGDGCFQIFENPIQAFIFNINFFINLHTYNSFRYYPKFRIYTGEFFYRSCITSGEIFSYEKNHYGPAIITNARILSKDRLNRFLIDENTYKWFLTYIDGVESLSEITLEELIKILKIDLGLVSSAIFRNNESYKMNTNNKYGREFGKIKSCHVQKIGNISAKADIFSIYNLELQIYVYIFDPKNKETGKGIVVSIGNSNNSGIDN